MGCRSETKARAALETIPTNRGTILTVWTVDLSSYKSVLAFAERARSLPRLDGFVANAGLEPQEFTTFEDIELTILVNVVSTVLCGMAVLPVLRSTADKYGTATLQFVGSMQHFFGDYGKLVNIPPTNDIIDYLSDPTRNGQMSGRYALSKLLLHLAVHRLAPRAGPGVVVNIVNPGWCGTELSREKPMVGAQAFVFRRIGRTPEEGARTLIHGVVAGRESHDKYLSECVVKPESVWMRSQEAVTVADRLWTELERRYRKVSPEVVGFVL